MRIYTAIMLAVLLAATAHTARASCSDYAYLNIQHSDAFGMRGWWVDAGEDGLAPLDMMDEYFAPGMSGWIRQTWESIYGEDYYGTINGARLFRDAGLCE